MLRMGAELRRGNLILVLRVDPQDPEKSISWSHAWEIVCGKIYLDGNRSCRLGPTFIGPTVEKVQPYLQQGQNKGQRPAYLLHIKA